MMTTVATKNDADPELGEEYVGENNKHHQQRNYHSSNSSSQVRYAPLSIEEGQGATAELSATGRFIFCKCRRCFIVAASLAVSTLLIAISVSVFVPTLNVPWNNWRYNIKSFTTKPSCPVDKNKTRLERVHPSELELNRVAQPLFNTTNLHGAHAGFVWNSEDANTTKWRPQGIAIATFLEKKYALVSWYGRADQDYANRGVRVSFVDFSTNRYSHVLLVDHDLCTFASLHAGGIEYLEGKLHVPDSRHKSRIVRVFDVRLGLYKVSQDDTFLGYKYILVQESMYNVPTVPSFVSYDYTRNMMIIGTYYHCGGSASKRHVDTPKCLSRPENKLAWYGLSEDDDQSNNNSSNYCTPFFSEMQGVAISTHSNNQSVLWVVSSYGPHFDSHLHVLIGFDPSSCDNGTWSGVAQNYSTLSYPPGLEDLHIEKLVNDKRQELWMLTEFGTRTVFGTGIEKLLPR